MTLYQLYATIEADSLAGAWDIASNELPRGFSQIEGHRAAGAGVREFRLEAINGPGAGIQRVEAEFGEPEVER